MSATTISARPSVLPLIDGLADTNQRRGGARAAAGDESSQSSPAGGVLELWLPIPGWEREYEVSDQGGVRSLDRTIRVLGVQRHRVIKGRALKPQSGQYGHLSVVLCRGGEEHKLLVHRLVILTFVGPCPEGMEVRHLDGVPTHNWPANLAYGTHAENVRDSVRHGTHSEVRKVVCRSGHPYSPENTRIDPRGKRVCLTCQQAHIARQRERRRKLRASAA